MTDTKTILEAEFDPKVCKYWLISGIVILCVTLVGIVLLPIWIILGLVFTQKYLDHMSCTLTEKALVVRKGLFNRIEKTVPLGKITDLAIKQGPIMRAMELHTITVETAGSSSGASGGSLVGLTGIVNTIEFRNRVLAQRDMLEDMSAGGHAGTDSIGSVDDARVLEEIRDTLKRIEGHLDRKH